MISYYIADGPSRRDNGFLASLGTVSEALPSVTLRPDFLLSAYRLTVREHFFRYSALLWRVVRVPFWLALGAFLGFVGPYAVYLDGQVRARFDDLSWDLPSRVYARPLELKPGMPMNVEALELELDAARYNNDGQGRIAGTFAHDGNRYLITRRAFDYLDGHEAERRIEVTLISNAVGTLRYRAGGTPHRASRRSAAVARGRIAGGRGS
jgi:hypothetical protein